MKQRNYLLILIAALSLTMACKNVNYKKTKSGLLYKIFPANGKDSLIKTGYVVKFHYKTKYNDSAMFTTYDKAPAFFQVRPLDRPTYDFQEILTMMKKGDSAIVVQLSDTLMKQNPQLPPNVKKGDRVIFSLRIMDVFATDSLARLDFEKEKKNQLEEQTVKGVKEMEVYLASKNISAQKTGQGTFVHIDQQGTGPAADTGKYVTIKYTGKFLTDTVFESNTYSLIIGKDPVIQGWNEGLRLFKQGGKGTLYIPGFLAWGDSGAGPDPKPFTPVIFDVEVLLVADKPPGQENTQAGKN
ncbi:MAG TPA: FKBP-type peptidyl-prolyl cis-trans isomerase [Chitinophagaceae bacterium]|nr:FKBP-type peptidyl-prolyl cis-trans isomerase [Chitinophagaceae bacterium]